MFAGSGAMGFEALSQGAQTVIFLELDRTVASAIRQSVDKLGCQAQAQVITTDAIAWLKQSAMSFDLIFMDPPFHAGLYEKAIKVATERLKRSGILYIESDQLIDDSKLAQFGLSAIRRGKAGVVHYLLSVKNSADVQDN